MQSKEDIQENQYHFPYHHLTYEEDDAIYIFRHLFWGLTHYTYLWHVVRLIQQCDFESLADVGCGEGRIICEIEKKDQKNAILHGYDISMRAIKFAKAFSIQGEFAIHDITREPLAKKYDVIVSCEVIEHIPPENAQVFIDNIHASLNQNGKLILTTPSTNVAVNRKHYQHFTSEMFDLLLNQKFTNIKYEYLNKVNLLSKVLNSLIANRIFVTNSRVINRFVLNLYKKYCLYGDANKGSRIVVTAVKQ